MTNASCNGSADGAIELDPNLGGVPGYTFLWSTGDASQDIFDLQAGIYIVTVTDSNGCSGVHEATVDEPFEISAMIASVSDVTCFGDSNGAIDISVTGGTGSYTYDWSNGNSSEDQSNLVTGFYDVTVTDENNCTAVIEDILVSEPSEILLSTNTTPASCNGGTDGTIDLIVTGGTPPYTYVWDPGFWTQSSIQDLSAGTYIVTVTDNNGCTATEAVVVDESTDLNLFISNDTTICPGETAQLEVSWIPNIAYSVQWSPTIGLNDPTVYNPIATPTETTLYTVTVEDLGGCIDTKEVLVTVNNYIDFGLQLFSNSPVCEGEQLEFYSNLSGATSYTWTGPNSFSSTAENPIIPVADATMTGQYELMIIDNAGCELNVTFDVLVDDDCVWPGDTDTNKVVNNFDLLNIGLAFDSVGPSRFGGSLSWIGQAVEDWSQSTPNTNVNFKHADTDGNGMVNSDDTLAISQNWGLMHNFTAVSYTHLTLPTTPYV